MSIQLKLGGHSFSVAELSDDIRSDSCRVEFVVMTHKNTLVPQELFDERVAADYLAINGVGCTSSESVVCSSTNDTIIAIMAIDSECLNSIRTTLGSRAQFTTPLLMEPLQKEMSIWLYRYDELLYIKVYDQVMRFAESVVATSNAGILYYISKLQREFGTQLRTLTVAGCESKQTAKLLKRYFKFKNVVCE